MSNITQEAASWSLLDDWQASGKSFEGFKAQIQKIESKTSLVEVFGPEIKLLSFRRELDEAGREVQTGSPLAVNAEFYELGDDMYAGINAQGLKTQQIRIDSLDRALYEEMRGPNGSHLCAVVGKDDSVKFYYISVNAIPTMATRAGVGGERIRLNSIFRDMYLREGLSLLGAGKKTNKLVVFSDAVLAPGENRLKQVKKIESMMGTYYTHIPQSVLYASAEKIMNSLGKKGVVRDWVVSHRFSEIRIEFPDEAEAAQKALGLPDKIIPGVVLMSSSTGDSAVRAYGTYRVEGKHFPVYQDEYAHRHVGTTNSDEVVEGIEKEILKDMISLPKALAEKQGRIIYEIKEGLSRERMKAARRENAKAVEALITKWAKDLRLVQILGKATTVALTDEMRAEIDPSEMYTEYDIAIQFMTLAERMRVNGTKLSDIMKENVAKCCAKAPYLRSPKQEAPKAVTLAPQA